MLWTGQLWFDARGGSGIFLLLPLWYPAFPSIWVPSQAKQSLLQPVFGLALHLWLSVHFYGKVHYDKYNFTFYRLHAVECLCVIWSVCTFLRSLKSLQLLMLLLPTFPVIKSCKFPAFLLHNFCNIVIRKSNLEEKYNWTVYKLYVGDYQNQSIWFNSTEFVYLCSSWFYSCKGSNCW